MQLQKSVGAIGFVLFLILALSTDTFAADVFKKQPMKVGVRISGSGRITDLDRKIGKYFKIEVEKRAVFSEEPVFEIFVNSERINRTNENDIIISVITTIRLPEEVVELGKKNEIFYSIFGSKKKWKNLPKEGKFVREYVTEDYLKKFCDIYEHEIYIVSETKLEEQCKKVINEFFEKYLPMKGVTK